MNLRKYNAYDIIYLLARRSIILRLLKKITSYFGFRIFLILILFFSIRKNSEAQQSYNPLNNVPVLNTKITLSLDKVTIQKILDTLSSYKDVKFSYINDELPLQHKISIHVNDMPLKAVLDLIFLNQGIQYIQVSKQIVLKKEEKIYLLRKHIPVNNLIDHFYFSLFVGKGITSKTLHAPGGNSERAKVNYTSSTYVTYQWSNSISLRGGFSFMSTEEKGSIPCPSKSSLSTKKNGNGNGHAFGNNQASSNTATQASTCGDISYINNYSYLSFPVMIGYTVKKNKWMFSGFSGIGNGFLLSHSTIIKNSPESTAQYSVTSYTLRKQVIMIPGRVETVYRINNNFGISGAFSFNCFVSSIYTSNVSVKSRPCNLSAVIGLCYFPGK